METRKTSSIAKIDNDIRHQSGQNVAPRESTTFHAKESVYFKAPPKSPELKLLQQNHR